MKKSSFPLVSAQPTLPRASPPVIIKGRFPESNQPAAICIFEILISRRQGSKEGGQGEKIVRMEAGRGRDVKKRREEVRREGKQRPNSERREGGDEEVKRESKGEKEKVR